MAIETGKRLILHTETLDLASIATGTDVDTAFTVVGAKVGNVAMVSAPSLETGLVASAFVSGADQVTLRVSNVTAGAVDPASQDFIIAVTQG